MLKTSRIPGFYRRKIRDRRRAIADAAGLDRVDLDALSCGALPPEAADLMIENVVGTFAFPVGVGLNMRINDQDVLVPMVVEEPSVVAATSNMAQLIRKAGGFQADTDPSVMIGQVQVTGLTDPEASRAALEDQLDRLSEIAAAVHPDLIAHGGGLRGMEVRSLVYDEPGETPEPMLVLHFFLDCADAMGANMVNTVAERLAPEVAAVAGGRIGLRILSNLASRRLARASCTIPAHLFDRPAMNGAPAVQGNDVIRGIASAYRFAWTDPWRAATHNKGVMNGIDAVALATGNDWRAIEAGAHAWAARDGQYRSLTSWKVRTGTGADGGDVLHGHIELPMQVGTVGGTIGHHPTVRANLKIMGSPRASTLAQVMAAVGLAQNLGALRALAGEGIQQGHMRLHARHVAVKAGATASEVDTVVDQLCDDKDWSESAARLVLAGLREDG